MRAIDIAAEAFSFLSPATPATSATTRANACSAPLRQVCDTCDTAGGDGSPGVACRKCRNGVATPETRANARLSQVSQLSQGVGPDSRSRRAEVLARLLLWGWPRDEAEATAARIARRDADDDRRTCAECTAFRPGRCARHRAAGLFSPEIGRDFAALPQRCGGFRRDV